MLNTIFANKYNINVHDFIEDYIQENAEHLDPTSVLADMKAIAQEGTFFILNAYLMELAFARRDIYNTLPAEYKNHFFNGQGHLMTWGIIQDKNLKETQALKTFLKMYGENMPYSLWKIMSFKHLLQDNLKDISEESLTVLKQLTEFGFDTPIKNLVAIETIPEIELVL